jgi:hypothetical protein
VFLTGTLTVSMIYISSQMEFVDVGYVFNEEQRDYFLTEIKIILRNLMLLPKTIDETKEVRISGFCFCGINLSERLRSSMANIPNIPELTPEMRLNVFHVGLLVFKSGFCSQKIDIWSFLKNLITIFLHLKTEKYEDDEVRTIQKNLSDVFIWLNNAFVCSDDEPLKSLTEFGCEERLNERYSTRFFFDYRERNNLDNIFGNVVKDMFLSKKIGYIIHTTCFCTRNWTCSFELETMSKLYNTILKEDRTVSISYENEGHDVSGPSFLGNLEIILRDRDPTGVKINIVRLFDSFLKIKYRSKKYIPFRLEYLNSLNELFDSFHAFQSV